MPKVTETKDKITVEKKDDNIKIIPKININSPEDKIEENSELL